MNDFVHEIQDKTPKQHYLLNKLLQNAHKEGFNTMQDLPSDYSFGGRNRTGSMLAAAKDHDIVAIMANQFGENPHRLSIDQARKLLSEKKTIYKDKLGRPTQGQMLRDQQIASNIKDMVRNRAGSTTPLRSSSSLSLRQGDMISSIKKKRNTRNLMIQGSSTKNQYTPSNYFSLSQTQKV